MALVTNSYMEITLEIADRDLNKAKASVKLPAATTLAQATTFINGSLITLIQAISNGIVYGWSISLGAKETDPTVVAVEASDVQRKGSFRFRAANGTPVKLEVPSINNNFVVDFTNVLDPTATEVTDLVDLMVNGDGTVAPISNAGSSVAVFNGAFKIHRQSSAG